MGIFSALTITPYIVVAAIASSLVLVHACDEPTNPIEDTRLNARGTRVGDAMILHAMPHAYD